MQPQSYQTPSEMVNGLLFKVQSRDFEMITQKKVLEKNLSTLHFSLRLPIELKELVLEKAKTDLQTPSREIVLLLCKALNIDPAKFLTKEK